MNQVKAPTKRELHAEERRNQFVDTALELFSKKGFENTTIKDLSEAAGVAQGLFYHYFATKDEMLLAVLERHGINRELRRVISPAHDRPARQVLLKASAALYDLFTERESLIRIFVREAMTNPALAARWVKLVREGVEIVSAYLKARIAAGELKPHHTDVAARMLMHPVCMLHLTGESAARLSELVGILLEGIAIEKKT